MARPRPTVRLEHTDPKTYKSEQVLDADFIYAVYMDGRPINLRTLNSLVNYPGPKYKKTAFNVPYKSPYSPLTVCAAVPMAMVKHGEKRAQKRSQTVVLRKYGWICYIQTTQDQAGY